MKSASAKQKIIQRNDSRYLTGDPQYQPCVIDEEDECFSNGIFIFNITKMLTHIAAHPDRYLIEQIRVGDVWHKEFSRLDATAVASADLANPILLAEIAPNRFNVIDGNHRAA
jgi:hypothetical protein